MRLPRTEHIPVPNIRNRSNNNLVERLNGTVRERNKVIRGLKKEDTPITRGFQIYYNFVKPHQALNGQTPAERSGIEMSSDENKWLQLIRQGVQRKENLKNKRNEQLMEIDA